MTENVTLAIKKEIYDITIIGAGPVGLFTAFYAHMREARVKIIDSLEEVGGQPAHVYPEKNIFDIPAYAEINGQDLGHQLLKQLERFDTELCLGEEALTINKIEDPTGEMEEIFSIQTNKATHYSRTLIIAAGNGAFQPRKLNLPEAETAEYNNLHYYVKNLQQFKNKKVAICGGGDSAVDWALTLEPLAEKVSIIHRRKQFRALEHSVSLLENSTVEILTPFVPSKLISNQQQIMAVELVKPRSEESQLLEIDHLIVNYGFSTSIGSLKGWGFETVRNQIKVDNQLETSVKGIFAVGDIADYEGKVRIIATGFGEAPHAVNFALKHINPAYRQSPVHSSSLFEGE